MAVVAPGEGRENWRGREREGVEPAPRVTGVEHRPASADDAEELARSWGHATVWLTTPENHPHLPGFYRRRGYEVTRPHPLDFREYDEGVADKRVG